ncbi:MAG: hypothetical protein HY235_17965 [Acidobacteria bacterium]|nr:hypothetical protein [Acidobacteriota bacterium]
MFGLNACLIHRLFTAEYLKHLHSVEGSFIAISRLLVEHSFHIGWWPFWNLGMPFEHTYLPLLPMTVALYARTAGISAALSYHGVTAFFYCLGSVTLFLMA